MLVIRWHLNGPRSGNHRSIIVVGDFDPSLGHCRCLGSLGNLNRQIRRLLQRRTQVSLAEVAAAHPLEHGLAELVAYLSLASDDPAAIIDEERREAIQWTDTEGRRRQATVPLVIFGRAVAVGMHTGAAP